MPLSSDPEKRKRQLRNLVPGARTAPAGNQRALVFGHRSELLVKDVEAEVRELMDALGEAAPVREADGSVPAADVVALEQAARVLKRWRHVSGALDLYGRVNARSGKVKPAAEYELKLERELAASLAALGMTPASRARLGVDLARSFDLAAHWAAQPFDDDPLRMDADVEGEAEDG